MIFREAIKLRSRASEPLGMRGPEKRPLELQRFFFVGRGVSAYLNKFNTLNCIELPS